MRRSARPLSRRRERAVPLRRLAPNDAQEGARRAFRTAAPIPLRAGLEPSAARFVPLPSRLLRPPGQPQPSTEGCVAYPELVGGVLDRQISDAIDDSGLARQRWMPAAVPVWPSAGFRPVFDHAIGYAEPFGCRLHRRKSDAVNGDRLGVAGHPPLPIRAASRRSFSVGPPADPCPVQDHLVGYAERFGCCSCRRESDAVNGDGLCPAARLGLPIRPAPFCHLQPKRKGLGTDPKGFGSGCLSRVRHAINDARPAEHDYLLGNSSATPFGCHASHAGRLPTLLRAPPQIQRFLEASHIGRHGPPCVLRDAPPRPERRAKRASKGGRSSG